MSELFFRYGPDPFLFDTEESKLYQLKDKRRIEIKNSIILRNVRLESVEIDREQAFKLAGINR